MKRLKFLFLVLILLGTLGVFTGCSETVTDFKIENYQTQFDLMQEYTLGNQAVLKKQVNDEWVEATLEEIQIVSTNYNQYKHGNYYVKVKHKNCDKVFTLNVTVNKISPNFEPLGKFSATYGQTLADINLPNGYSWPNPEMEVGDVTNYYGREFDVVFTKGENYLPVIGKVRVVVIKATPQFEPIENLTAQYLQTLSQLDLPNGYAWENPNLFVGDCNIEGNTFNVIYTKGENYESVIGTVKVFVSKINPTVNPNYDTSIILRYGQNMPQLSLSYGDTEGTLCWQEGQTLKTGTHIYNWQFTPSTNNYFETSGTITLTVQKQIVQLPSSVTLEYNGQAQSVLSLFTNDLWNVSGTTSATQKGTYYVTLDLKDKSNYIWAGGLNLAVEIKWEIK